MAATLGSSMLGFGREVINARLYGTWWQMDAFLAAATIPTILFGIFNGALVSALVPVFSEYVARDDWEGVRRLASTIFNGLLLALTMLAALGWALAPELVPVVAQGFPPQQLAVTVEMTRWLLPSIVATSLAGVASAMLNAHQRFFWSAVQGTAINLVTIAVVLALNPKMGIFALVLGTALGLFAQLLVQLPALVQLRMWRPVIDLSHPGLAKIWEMLGAIVVGSAAGQIAIFFDRHFASTLSPGYISGMNYATKLVGFPQQVFAAAIATVIFPLLASQFASANRNGIKRSVVMGLRLVNLVTIPSVFGLIALSYPIMTVRGALALRGDRSGRRRRQHRLDALLLCVQGDPLAGCDFGLCRRTQRRALGRVAADARRARLTAGERYQPIDAGGAVVRARIPARQRSGLEGDRGLGRAHRHLLDRDGLGLALDRRARRPPRCEFRIARLVLARAISDRHARLSRRRATLGRGRTRHRGCADRAQVRTRYAEPAREPRGSDCLTAPPFAGGGWRIASSSGTAR